MTDPETASDAPCPCGSGLSLAACCGRYHTGEPAPTAEALMRLRYAAYALGRLDYIEATSGGSAALAFDRAEAEMSRLGMRWTGLTIHDVRDGGRTDARGTVRFTARYVMKDAPGALEETSAFRKVAGRWLYWDRVETRTLGGTGAKKPGRNDPCPCGSGRKYKACCGRAG
ncbi:MAG: YchJ family protein [Hoeflea sp. D1-CHI-28]